MFLTSPIYKPAPLHVPDGFLTLSMALLSWGVTIVLLGLAVKRSKTALNDRQVPLMGIMAAFIFAAQMLNFPVAGGTSGHFLGGALAAIVLGPWAGMLVMASVIGIQALLFQDGGLLVMGANILNMGLLTVLIGFGMYRLVVGRNSKIRLWVTGVAAWFSLMAGAVGTSLMLWLSGTSPLRVVFPAMVGVHALIGIGEALITVAAISFISKVRPELLDKKAVQSRGGRSWVVVGLVLSVLMVIAAPLASSNPDGLERVAVELGFIQMGVESSYEILPDYKIPALGETGLSIILAGVVGALVVAIVVIFIGSRLKRPPARESWHGER
jgi:cobalt/nickel transport system permease protein